MHFICSLAKNEECQNKNFQVLQSNPKQFGIYWQDWQDT